MENIREMEESMKTAEGTSASCCEIFTKQPVSYGMAYVPYQSWSKVYDPAVAFERGTIFPCLDKPFIGEEAVPHE